MAEIALTRSKGGGLMGIAVLVDGEKAGRVGPGKTVSFEVATGRHEVKLKRGFAHIEAEVDVGEGERIQLYCSEDSGFSSSGKVSASKTVKALGGKGGLHLWLEEDAASE